MFCQKQQNSGYLVDGVYVEYVVVFVYGVVCVLDGVFLFDVVLFICVGVMIYKVIKVVDVMFVEWVVVFGIGGFGYFVVQYVCIVGGVVIVVDIDDIKFKFVEWFGVDYFVNVVQIDLVVVVDGLVCE